VAGQARDGSLNDHAQEIGKPCGSLSQRMISRGQAPNERINYHHGRALSNRGTNPLKLRQDCRCYDG
jgi:hypothetical protein